MIRDAIQKIQDLVLENKKELKVDINGDIYTERKLERVDKYIPKRNHMRLSNLTSLVEMIKRDLKDDNTDLPLRLIVKEKEVNVYSSLDVNKDREQLYNVIAQVADINFNNHLSVEEMIIQLQTNFEDTDNKSKLINKISKLSQGVSVEVADDGISQSVVQKTGVTTTETVDLQPLVRLIPKRTFHECKQPEQLFLLRINKHMQIALFDAAGGIWKHHCQESIREYLKEQLNEEIASEKVIVG